MEQLLATLNEKQRQAVTSEKQHLRIIAGAGSGKTKVLTTRIAYLIEHWGIVPSSILAITFTNKAAAEMRSRIESALGGNLMGAHISTIHSFCVTLLRQEIRYENYPSNFTILDGDDQKSIVKEAIKQLGFDSKEFHMASILDYIGNMKTAGYDEDGARNLAYSTHEEKLSKIYGYYLDRCHQLYALDFDDLLLFSNRILKKNPKVREKWQNKFNFILVDEFQDIDNVQYELIELLCNANTYLYVVGDPDQTIYSWRGANIDIIMDFVKTYPDTETIVLEQNYRSTQNILNAANSLIQYNKYRVKKDLYTANDEGDLVSHFTAGSDDLEAGYVTERILDLNRKGVTFDNIAILYRNNNLSRMIERSLMDMKIPYVIYGGVRFYDRAEIKDMLCYLRMITTSDDLAFKRVINEPKRGIGEKSVEDLMSYARQHNSIAFNCIDEYECPKKLKDKLTDFKQMIDGWKEKLNEGTSLPQLFELALEQSGYRAMLENSDDPKDLERLDNVKELINDVGQFEIDNPQAGLNEYLGNVALYTDVQSDKTTQSVSLMTVHAAKGLEFENVFVIGLSEGIFPSQRTVDESGVKGIEEERRLAYVAYTRAKKRLFLTDSAGFNFITSTEKSTSRFVREIDEQYLKSLNKVYSRPATVSETPSISTHSAPGGKKKYAPGDVVVHDSFGEGIVTKVDIQRRIVTIAFPYPYMTKTLAMDFGKMHKKED